MILVDVNTNKFTTNVLTKRFLFGNSVVLKKGYITVNTLEKTRYYDSV